MTSEDPIIDEMMVRLSEMEKAMEKIGLRKCRYTGQWFKILEGGIILQDGSSVSWESIPANWEVMAVADCRELCVALVSTHKRTIESALLEHAIAPSPVTRAAEAMGWRYPLRESAGHFRMWLEQRGWKL